MPQTPDAAAGTGAATSTRPRKPRWLLREPDPDADRLLCFPFAGTGASSYRSWPARIGPLEVCPVQLPGRENRLRDEPYHDFETFADDAVSALEGHLDRPYALFGHCMGALLAYAFLVRVQEAGLRLPERLYVSSSLVPSRGFFGLFRPSMTDEELTDELSRVARAMGGSGEMLPELLEIAIALLRNDMDMCLHYKPPGPYPLQPPITTIGWTDDPDVPPDEMREWADYGAVTHHVLSGDALAYLTAPVELIELIAHDYESSNV